MHLVSLGTPEVLFGRLGGISCVAQTVGGGGKALVGQFRWLGGPAVQNESSGTGLVRVG